MVYRPPGDQRSYTCRVVTIEGGQAYLEPVIKECTGWVSIENLLPEKSEATLTALPEKKSFNLM